jgi:hypothetical protein
MPVAILWHAHVPDPKYLRDVEHKTIMLDVGTLLRGILFPESHSARLLEHIERSPGACAVICPHVRDTAVSLLASLWPDLGPQFAAGLLAYIQRKTITVAQDGDPKTLPPDVAFDASDDDIVIATALSSGCHYLATLDSECATHAGEVIEILPPSQPECNRFFSTQTTIDVPIFSGPKQGSLILEVMPSEGSTGYKIANGRRYVLYAGDSLGIWLSESSWRYEVGIPSAREPLFQFKELPLDHHVLLAISYDCTDRRLIGGCDAQDGTAPQCTQIKGRHLPSSIGNFGMLSRGDKDSFFGYWRGVLSTRKFVESKALDFSLKHKCHFDPLDAHQFKIPDAVFEPACILVPKSIG